jgi:hypothetical protein
MSSLCRFKQSYPKYQNMDVFILPRKFPWALIVTPFAQRLETRGILQLRDTQFRHQHNNPILTYLYNKTGSQPADYSCLHHQMRDVPCRMYEVWCPFSALKERKDICYAGVNYTKWYLV